MSIPNPLVSILTPSYNSARFIEKTIISVKKQEYPFIEHIIMDGGSSDDTISVLKKYSELIWRSERDHGQADALNKAFRSSKGEIIGWINSDDTYQPGILNKAVDFLQTHADVSVVYGNINFIDERDKVFSKLTAKSFSLETYLLEDYIPQQAAFFKRAALEDVNGWNMDLNYIMDYDLFLRLGKRHKMVYLPHTWGNFRVYDGTKTMTDGIIQSRQERISVLQNFFEEPDICQEIRGFRLRILDYSNAILKLAYALKFYQDMQYKEASQLLQEACKMAPILVSNNAEILADNILTWLGRHTSLPPIAFIEGIISHLPPALEWKGEILKSKLLPPSQFLALLRSYQSGNLPEARHNFIRLIQRDPTKIFNRGVLSIGVETIIGKRIADFARGLFPD
jgi:glycosyltransferase involved in cell wall biosynthesis